MLCFDRTAVVSISIRVLKTSLFRLLDGFSVKSGGVVKYVIQNPKPEANRDSDHVVTIVAPTGNGIMSPSNRVHSSQVFHLVSVSVSCNATELPVPSHISAKPSVLKQVLCSIISQPVINPD